VYEVPDVEVLPDNGHYLGIDLGVKNLMACYDSTASSLEEAVISILSGILERKFM